MPFYKIHAISLLFVNLEQAISICRPDNKLFIHPRYHEVKQIARTLSWSLCNQFQNGSHVLAKRAKIMKTSKIVQIN